MCDEIEILSSAVSDTTSCHEMALYDMKNSLNIKHDLESSFLNTKVKLLEQTLNTKLEEIKALESFKENNAQLLQLVEKYDVKMSQMQQAIDVRDLRINELIEKYADDSKGNFYLILYDPNQILLSTIIFV